jgi:septum site-determining protein MinD
MSTIVSVHSYRGGTGKSNLTANLASCVAQQGKRVAVIDTDIQSPGLHVLFGMDGQTTGLTLNDYLHGRCGIEQAAHDVTDRLGPAAAPGGALSLILSDILVLLLRPDQQDFQGTAVTVEVARKLKVKRLLLVVNKVLPKLDKASLRQQVQTIYSAPVAGILPVSEEMIELGSAGIFSLASPDHPYSQGVREIAVQIMNPAAVW